MKIRLTAYIMVFLCIFSCRNKNNNSLLLDKAESLMEMYPDSANAILKGMDLEVSENDDFARWCMLFSLMAFSFPENGYLSQPKLQIAHNYYEKHGNDEQRAYSTLFLGQSYYELSQYEDAMKLYLTAMETAKKSKQYNVSGYISNNMGDLYYMEGLYGIAAEKYDESAGYFRLSGNHRSEALALSSTGFCYLMDNQSKNGLKYMIKADSVAQNICDTETIANIFQNVGTAYSEIGQIDSAETYYMKTLAIEKGDSAVIYYALCDLYIQKNDFQKAREILDKGTSESTKDGIYLHRYMIEKAAGDYEAALKYHELYMQASDSIDKDMDNIYILETEKKYTEEKTINELNSIKISRQRMWLAIATLIIIVLTLLYIYQSIMKHKDELLLKQREEMDAMDNKIADMNASLEKTQTTLNDNTEELEDKKVKIKKLHEQIFDAKLERLKLSTTVCKRIMKLQQKTVPQSARKPLSADEWNVLKETLSETFPKIEMLLENPQLNLNDSDKRCILLSFLKLDAKSESILMDVQWDSITKYRYNARKKIVPDESGLPLFDCVKNYCTKN